MVAGYVCCFGSFAFVVTLLLQLREHAPAASSREALADIPFGEPSPYRYKHMLAKLVLNAELHAPTSVFRALGARSGFLELLALAALSRVRGAGGSALA